MEIKQPAVCGTLESSDVMIAVRPNPDGGIRLELQSVVSAIFGKAIEKTVRNVLEELRVSDAVVEIHDRGALDPVIRARTQAAVCRAAGTHYDWTKED